MYSVLLVLILSAIFYIYAVQCAKRVHDLGYHGFWGIIEAFLMLIPFVNIIFIVQLYFLKGTNGINKYGKPSNYGTNKFHNQSQIVKAKKEQVIPQYILERKENDNKQQFEKDISAKLLHDIRENIKITVTPQNSPNHNNDNSIIDVTDQSYQINLNSSLKKYNNSVPYWTHHYVYSYSELKDASAEQKKFYFFFKNKFLNREYLDLEGNTNYAFILLFNLLDEYESHKDIAKLEKQLQALGQNYPKTKSYCNSFLIKKMNLIGYSEGVTRIQEETKYVQYWWKLGNKYKDKLNLNEEDVNLLNDLQYSSNSFNGIEFCMIEILKLYISTCNRLKQAYIDEQTTIEIEFEKIAKIVLAYKTVNYYYYTITSFYSHIFKCCENAVREYYKHRKLNVDYYYSESAKKEYEERIFSKVTVIISDLIAQITQPNEEIEILLFAQSTGRWKYQYKEIKENYNNNNSQFVDRVIKLSELNKLNQQGVEDMFYEATKFIVKYDNETAIKLYFYYLANAISNHKILTDKRLMALIIGRNLEEAQKLLKNEYPIVPKLFKFNSSLIEKLFKTNEQLGNFEKIFEEFLNDKNIDNAITKIPNIYRKRIRLNNASVLEAKQQHSGTVELLNEYLKDDDENDIKVEKRQATDEKESKIEIIHKTEEIQNSIDIVFTQIQMSTLDFFVKSNFSVLQSEFGTFAKSRGIFKNQLIESINNICYERLDDILIEEDDDYYTINPDYYRTLLAK
jgi:hypothetical protein